MNSKGPRRRLIAPVCREASNRSQDRGRGFTPQPPNKSPASAGLFVTARGGAASRSPPEYLNKGIALYRVFYAAAAFPLPLLRACRHVSGGNPCQILRLRLVAEPAA
jgi:hypothetical protein